MNLLHYVKKYGNCSWEEKAFTDIDNVIFSQLSYLPLEGIVGTNSILLKEVARVLEMEEKAKAAALNTWFSKKVYALLKEMAKTRRYQNILFSHYVKVIHHDCQFGAITLTLPDKSIYVSYEGTDDAISGWLEDACMVYQFPVPAQELAAQYLKKYFRFYHHTIRVGGHSKGGNLAVYAAMQAPFYLQKHIVAVYSNDGPGFTKRETLTKKYQKIAKKIHKIVPQESVVGMLLYHPGDLLIVKSKSKRFLQHDPFNWQVEDDHFVEESSLSPYSKKVSKRVQQWVEKVNEENKERCVTSLFQVFDGAEVSNTHDLLHLQKSIRTVQEIHRMSADTKKDLLDVFRAIV